MNPLFSSLVCSDSYHYSFSIFLSNDSNVYSFGDIEYKAHGHKEQKINIPTQINNLTKIKMIDCGECHTICLTLNGNVFSFGKNNKGQLGVGKTKYQLKLTHIPQKINIPKVKQVSCGYYFSICLTEDNQLYSFGHNEDGQLILGSKTEIFTSPQLVPKLNNIEFIACGGYHCICRTFDNEYYSCGSNDEGQLGLDHYYDCRKPIQCKNWPDNIIDIKCGWRHTLLLTSEGQIYSFGSNRFGQLGINDENIEKIKIPTLLEDIPEIQKN